MARLSMMACLVVVCLFASAAAIQSKVRMHVLVLGTVPVTDPTIGGIKMALESRGQPFTYINVLDAHNNGELFELEDTANGRGLYSGIVRMSNGLAYEAAPGFWPSALTAVQWAQLDAYQLQYQVRQMSIHSWPAFAGATYHAAGATAFAQFTGEHEKLDAGLKSGARLELTGSYVTPANLDNAPTLTATSYLYNDDDSSSLPNGVGSCIQTDANLRETWHFFYIPTHYYSGQVQALHLSVNWLLRGVFLGKRRLYLGMQIDDLFLETGEWAIEFANDDDQELRPQVRSSAADLQLLSDYAKSVTETLPAGSKIMYEWAFNGEGVVEHGGYDSDTLGLHARAHPEDFYWVTHTYTHPYLTNYTYSQCKKELSKNWDAAHQIWGPTLPSEVEVTSMVNPAITGLFNAACLRAMKDEGIKNVVGDNSRSELIPKTSLYHGLWTTQEVNGQDGIFIIPRWATNIFFDNSEPQKNLVHFNHITPYTWTWEELISYEGRTACRNLLQYRPDPYMFHQGNVKGFSWAGWSTQASLMSLWTQSVVDHLLKYTAFPVVSPQEVEMAAELKARMARDACGIDATLVLEDYTPTRVEASSTGTCKLAISGFRGATTLEHEIYGSQHGGEMTVYADISPAAGTLLLDTGMNPKPTCPLVDGVLCAGNGFCNAAADPPICVCAGGFEGADCTTETFEWGPSILANGDFETGSTGAPWYGFVGGFTLTTAGGLAGSSQHLKTSGTVTSAEGAYQFVVVNQASATTLRISGFSKATDVLGAKDGNYAIYVDAVYADMTWQYGLSAQFNTGTHGWEEAVVVFTPAKPVQYLWVYCMHRYHGGVAEFDNIKIQETVQPASSYAPPREDGRCGSNSPDNAGCGGERPCCSTFGWCGSGSGHCTFQEEADSSSSSSSSGSDVTAAGSQQCTGCWPGTSGPCKHSDGTCWQLLGGQCPGGTLSCAAAPSISSADAEMVVLLLELEGVQPEAVSSDLQSSVESAIAGVSGSSVDNTFVSYVEPGTHSAVRGEQKTEVQVIVVVDGDNTAEGIANKVAQAASDGSLDATLAAEHFGVHAEVKGEPRIQQSVSAGSSGLGTAGIALIIGVAAVGAAVGALVAAVVLGRRSGGGSSRGGGDMRRRNSSSSVVNLLGQVSTRGGPAWNGPSTRKNQAVIGSDSEDSGYGDDAASVRSHRSARHGSMSSRVSKANDSRPGSAISGSYEEPDVIGTVTPRPDVESQ